MTVQRNVLLTVLVENTAASGGFLAEHGLSLLLEVGGRRILFDTGQGQVLKANAQRLGISFDSIEALVLSHGHYDHSGGLAAVLARSDRMPLFVHPAAFEPKYARNRDGSSREIGIPRNCRKAVEENAVIKESRLPGEVIPGVFMTGAVPRTSGFEDTGGPFFQDPDCSTPDDLSDDQALFFDTTDGIVVILGCAHAGVANTLSYIRQLAGGRPFSTVIGGMHLRSADRDRVDLTIAALQRLEVRKLYPLHCTGFAASARLWQDFPGAVFPAPAGTVLRFS